MLSDYLTPQKEQKNGVSVLQDPTRNKGTAFTAKERKELKLRGLLPPRIFTQDEQVSRVLENLRRKTSPIEKYIYLMSLQDRNESLFFRVVMSHLDEMMPLIYTPTVGQACQEYGHIFRRPRGLFISVDDVGHMDEIISNWHSEDVQVIVVTDGERILGLGDLGANGMGIPVGKLALYTACAGIHPHQCLPITLDVGTNNETLQKDPLYIGLQQKRLTGASYDAFVDEFVTAVRNRYPNALIQFEDFGNHNAFRLLQNYQSKICTFNDDIQGTASVTLAGLLGAMKLLISTGATTSLNSISKLAKAKVLFFGAGEAGIGTADLLVRAFEREGMKTEDAMAHCWFVDSKGLIVNSRTDINENKRRYAHEAPFLTNLAEIVDYVQPTALVGVSGQPAVFTEEVIRKMSAINQRPIIFALSNPTSKAECTAEQAYNYSEGRAIFASGSPFDPVTYEDKTFVPGQANNSYIFPGVGLGVLASGAKHVTDEMFLAAAQTLAELAQPDDLKLGRIFPPLTSVREISAHIAVAVARVAHSEKLATKPAPTEDWLSYVKSLMYNPEY